MVSINTNLSSLIVQSNLTKSTNGVNQAIERLTTGFRINHASDNAANYAISENMSSKISSLQVAEENTMMGLDMVQTANSAMDEIANLTERLRYLAEQAYNGTYGEQSLNAINREAESLVSEIDRIKSNAVYNGIELLNGIGGYSDEGAYLRSLIAKHYVDVPVPSASGASGASNASDTSGSSESEQEETEIEYISNSIGTYGTAPVAAYGNFITNPYTYTDEEVAAMMSVEEALSGGFGIEEGHVYSIKNLDDLAYLQACINCNEGNLAAEFVLADDIELTTHSDIQIGDEHDFVGIFNGNGHSITGYTGAGLFKKVGENGTIKNLGIGVNTVEAGSSATGALVEHLGGDVSNCYSTGSINASSSNIGGLIGLATSGAEITDSWSSCTVNGASSTGGLVGEADFTVSITSCYTTGSVTGWRGTGGLVGSSNGSITNCYSTGAVTSASGSNVGGLVGSSHGSITNCYATGTVDATEGHNVGGIAGDAKFVANSYFAGGVTGHYMTGGLVGNMEGSVTNCYVTGTVQGHDSTGGLLGHAASGVSITNSYSMNEVQGSGENNGALIGQVWDYNYGGVPASGTFVDYSSALNSGMKACGNSDESFDATGGLSLDGAGGGPITLQVGVNGDSGSQITYNLEMPTGDLSSLVAGGLQQAGVLEAIDDYLSGISENQVKLGAVENRLTSALETISVNYDNLVSSRSTLRDADVGKVSSQLIRNQILQQASATLLATANQSPALALRLLGAM